MEENLCIEKILTFDYILCCGLHQSLMKAYSIVVKTSRFLYSEILFYVGFRIHSSSCPSSWFYTSPNLCVSPHNSATSTCEVLILLTILFFLLYNGKFLHGANFRDFCNHEKYNHEIFTHELLNMLNGN